MTLNVHFESNEMAWVTYALLTIPFTRGILHTSIPIDNFRSS